MANHTRNCRWPYTDVVLRCHVGAGQWYKTINGRMHYFGVLADPTAARKRYLAFLQNGEARAAPPEPPADGLPLSWLVNGFLTKRSALVEAGERSAGQFARYRAAGQLLVDSFGRSCTVQGLSPTDFARLRKTINGGPVHVGNVVRDIRTIFHWGFKHFGVAPRYGDEFEKPGKRVVRAASRQRQLWTSAEISASSHMPAPPCGVSFYLASTAHSAKATAQVSIGEFSTSNRTGCRVARPSLIAAAHSGQRRWPHLPATIAQNRKISIDTCFSSPGSACRGYVKMSNGMRGVRSSSVLSRNRSRVQIPYRPPNFMACSAIG